MELLAIQPFKTLGVLTLALVTFVKLPYWLAYYSIFGPPRPSWTLGLWLRVVITRHLASIAIRCRIPVGQRNKTRLEDQRSLKETRFVRINPATTSRGIATIKPSVLPAPVNSFLWPKEGFDASVGGYFLLMFHGGAYYMGTAHESDPYAVYPRTLTKFKNICGALSVDYRLTSDAATPFPGALQDAIAAYQYVVEDLAIAPKRIIVQGDSAGGNLALALVRYIRDELEAMMPAGLLLFSPWVDLSMRAYPGNWDTCFCCVEISDPFTTSIFAQGDPSLLESIYVSPGGACLDAEDDLFKDFPNTFISCGDAERCFHQDVILHERMRRSQVPVTLNIKRDAIHDYAILGYWPGQLELFNTVSQWISSLPLPGTDSSDD